MTEIFIFPATSELIGRLFIKEESYTWQYEMSEISVINNPFLELNAVLS